MNFHGGSVGKESACMQETQVQSLGLEDPLEKETATHPSILAWRIPWIEEPGGLQSIRLQRFRQAKNGLPFPSPGDIPDPRIKPRSPALQVYSLLSEPPEKPQILSRSIY